MFNFETILTAAIILGAGIWLVRWLRSNAKGEGGCGCGCGKCAKNPAGDGCGCGEH